jgi:hypothetical protein
VIHCGRAIRALGITLQRHGAGLQREGEPNNGEEAQCTARAGNPLSSADRLPVQKDLSVTISII